MQEISTKPYLLRALYEWCTDNGYTPHLAVRVDNMTRVPRQFVRDNEIVLNISFEATSQLKIGNELVEFTARFSGKAHKIEVPVANVLAIYARENGQGMAFPVETTDSTASHEATPEPGRLSAVSDTALVQDSALDGEHADVSADTDAHSSPDGDSGGNGTKSGARGHLKVVK
ncbi:ClpXP protease specificity-enhancing factor [Paraburkholderia hayleyella]|uniref:ClpXP protease specificity-enhancing factor n=1 Tax=Paraburkholderia hayleyella TaxID=2152889 RepID=UPI0012923DEE|nr:ClpXP protease specificity-enhancing factor [Paraburkholderia hayleyella]